MKIALYKGTSWMSKLITWQTRGIYSHASIILNNGEIIEAWQIGSGVRVIKSLSEGHTKNTLVDIFDFDHSQEGARLAEKFLEAQVGKKYDWRAIARFLTKRRGDNKDKWICSELVFAAVQHAGVDLLSRTEAYEVSPVMLGRSPLLQYAKTIVTT